MIEWLDRFEIVNSEYIAAYLLRIINYIILQYYFLYILFWISFIYLGI